MKAKAAGADELTQGQRENENGCTLRKQQPLRDGRRMRNNTGRGAAGETRGLLHRSKDGAKRLAVLTLWERVE